MKPGVDGAKNARRERALETPPETWDEKATNHSPYKSAVSTDAYRYVAYSLSGFAVVSVVAVCFSLPIVFSYVRTMKTSLERDIQYCRHTSRGIHEEMNRMNYEFGSETPQNRSARHSGYATGPSAYGGGGYTGAQSNGGNTQSCCQPGCKKSNPQEDQDAQEPMECQEPLDDPPEVPATHLPHPHHASLAQEAHQDHQDTPDLRESQAKLEPQDKASVVLHQARPDQRDPLELLEIPEAMDSPEIPASLHRAKAAVLLLQALRK
ncbi:hypothetical protein WR25_09527 [Diploscapter pachys]|uniref:Nematode cuticle collagen N-terminal domain-containing protein n=1 Tax=Diploscapter pachys TaxID=2018661 RepID=A0A2A2JXD2_9BILA|nr:hypothetical protein WR25_09527 [Diploscapter pachys]